MKMNITFAHLKLTRRLLKKILNFEINQGLLVMNYLPMILTMLYKFTRTMAFGFVNVMSFRIVCVVSIHWLWTILFKVKQIKLLLESESAVVREKFQRLFSEPKTCQFNPQSVQNYETLQLNF